MEVVVTTGAISRAKLQSDHHYQQTNTQFFYRPDALPVAQPTVSKHWREPIMEWSLKINQLSKNKDSGSTDSSYLLLPKSRTVEQRLYLLSCDCHLFVKDVVKGMYCQEQPLFWCSGNGLFSRLSRIWFPLRPICAVEEHLAKIALAVPRKFILKRWTLPSQDCITLYGIVFWRVTFNCVILRNANIEKVSSTVGQRLCVSFIPGGRSWRWRCFRHWKHHSTSLWVAASLFIWLPMVEWWVYGGNCCFWISIIMCR